MLISLDFDEVLFPLMVPFLDWLRLRYHSGLKLQAADVVNYDLKPFLRGKTMELIEEFYFSPEMQQTAPEPGAVDGVKALMVAGHTLVIITGRPELCAKQTKSQLIRHFPLIPVNYTNHYYDRKTTKQEECRRLGARWHVEDNVFMANDCARTGIKTILMRKPWKFSVRVNEDVVQVDNWPQLLAKFIKPA
jgi:hypothetical protein